MASSSFTSRHIGPREKDVTLMLRKIGASSLDELIDQTVPSNIRLKKPLNLPDGLSEHEYLTELKTVASRNKNFKTYIGQGYYNCIVPPAIQRNVLENPGWYTAYTPYQAEIAQGRLEALLNFQTMVIDLTGLPIANASLLDEATAAAEAMILFYNSRPKTKTDSKTFFISENCFPQTIDVVKTRALPLGIEVLVGDHSQIFSPEGGDKREGSIFGVLLQYPDAKGNVTDCKAFVNKLHASNVQVAVAADLMSLTLLVPPGEWGADIVLGNSQRFGVPMGYGGPHAAFFAAKEEYKRSLPGRIIGVSVDSSGNPALRMALQTREQHIRREKATSNICTAQALLAIMASMYGVYHGPQGLKAISEKIHHLACGISEQMEKLGLKNANKTFFDTIFVSISDKTLIQKIRTLSEAKKINFNYSQDNGIIISVDETTTGRDAKEIVEIFAEAQGKNSSVPSLNGETNKSVIRTSPFSRQSSYLTHPIFNTYHSETEMMRYIKRLENKDLSLTHSMISLGSCTMKLNAAAELYPITWPEFANIHPFVPAEQAEGYRIIISELEKFLCAITGFSAVSFQPNSGAQGEYAGLLTIRAYHHSNGNAHRKVVLIPSSAHGTNPASAAMAGMDIVIVKCDEKGNVDLKDLKEKAEKHTENLSCLMVTYPSTHGVFEEAITEITKIIHDNGGQVYMDGANMNAQVGLTSPATIGADVCHLNLHKTFAIPHGGGGPGMGPIGVAAHLVPFLPKAPASRRDNNEAGSVSASQFSSALILLISYGYIKMLGKQGVTDSTRYAILNANYMKDILKEHFPILYVGKSGRVAHEMILDCKEIKRTSGVEVADIAKRLMDYGFHAPTVSFPVADTLMVEPTESEGKAELDKFCEAMISIRQEIEEISAGKADKSDNLLKNSPHTAKVLIGDEWNHSYSKEKAAYPLKWVRENKFWPSVGRVDNAHGDRNLICACPPIEEYVSVE